MKERTKTKRNIILIVIISIFLIITIGGITYSWFTSVISGNDSSTENVVENATLSIEYKNGEELKGENIVPGWSETKTFTVENTGTVTATYNINWAYLINEFITKEDLVYTITSDNNGGTLEETILPNSANNIKILENITIEPKEIQTYTLTITYKDTNYDQSSNAEKNLQGKLEVSDVPGEVTNKCKIEVNVEKGTVKENIKIVDKNTKVEFEINPNTGYRNPEVTCKNNQTAIIEENKLTINEVTDNAECTVTYKDIINYQITYELNGGTLENPINEYTVESDITLPNPTKTGYSFEGWTTGDNETPEKNVTIPKGNHGDKTYTAVFTPIKYQVIYNTNGGQGTIENSEFTYDKTSLLPESTLTKEGYAFLGWSTNPNATEATYTNGQEVKNLTTESEVTLYAVWAKKYTANLNINGAEQIGDTNLSCIATEGSCTITLPTITAASGFEVIGWSTNKDATTAEANVGDKVTINQDTIYYAITKSKAPFYGIFKDDSALVELIDLVGDGELKDAGNSSKALWKTCYRYNGSSTCDIITPDFTRENWIKLGWGNYGTIEKTNDVNTKMTLSGNVTKYPMTKQIIEITYDANGGSEAPNSGTGIIYNSSTNTAITISDSEPIREGYTFLGWSEDKNATTVTYKKGIAKSFTESTTLYAVWQIKTYTAKVTVLNGTITGNTSKTVNYGSSPTFTVNPSSGYTNPEVECTNSQKAEIIESTLTVKKLSNDTTCTVTYKDATCFAFDSSTGTITDYYDYEGGGTSGTACPKDVSIPLKIKGINVTTIGNFAFYNNQLTTVTISSSVTTIKNYAFYNNKLTSVSMQSGVITIGDSAFSSNQLASVNIPGSVTSIGADAFYKNNLTTVTIPASVTSIGNGAFYIDSTSNSNLTSITNQTGSAFRWQCIVNVRGGDTCVSNVGDEKVRGTITTNTGKTLRIS